MFTIPIIGTIKAGPDGDNHVEFYPGAQKVLGVAPSAAIALAGQGEATLSDDFVTPLVCPICGQELEWHECGNCDGVGEIQTGETDFEPCALCDGVGGWQFCPNEVNHRVMK